jgi:hypothetical protein
LHFQVSSGAREMAPDHDGNRLKFGGQGMHHHVIVSFGEGREFEYKFSQAEAAKQSAAEARAWFDQEFIALEADVPSPIGKVLLADRILSVAKYAGERRFKEQVEWAERYARNAVALLARDFIKVDVANYTVGY